MPVPRSRYRSVTPSAVNCWSGAVARVAPEATGAVACCACTAGAHSVTLRATKQARGLKMRRGIELSFGRSLSRPVLIPEADCVPDDDEPGMCRGGGSSVSVEKTPDVREPAAGVLLADLDEPRDVVALEHHQAQHVVR